MSLSQNTKTYRLVGRMTTNCRVGRVHVPMVGVGQSIGAVCIKAREGAVGTQFFERQQQ